MRRRYAEHLRPTTAPAPWHLNYTGRTVQDWHFRDVEYPLYTWTCMHCGRHDPTERSSGLAYPLARQHYIDDHLPKGVPMPWA